MDSDVFLNLIKVEGRGQKWQKVAETNKGDQENSLTNLNLVLVRHS